VHARLVESALEQSATWPRTWADVAAETRQVYAAVGLRNRAERGLDRP
jgi:hypothetical protein